MFERRNCYYIYRMKYFFLSLLLFSLTGYAQKKQNIYFLKAERIVSSKDSADYIRIIQEPDSGSTNFLLFEYYLDNSKKRMGAVSKFESNLVFEGSVVSFYKTGKRKEVLVYENGLPTGNAYYYYPNGRLQKTLVYSKEEGMPVMLKFHNLIRYKVINYYDSTGVERIKDGTGYVSEAEEDGLFQEGAYVEGVKDGIWKGKYLESGNSFEEKYQKGTFIEGELLLQNGEKRQYAKMEEVPVFEGGMGRFFQYVAKTFEYSAEARKKGINGRIVVAFVVEKDGSLTDIKLLQDIGMGTGEEILRVMKGSPKWIPGTQRGIPVRVPYVLPITLNLSR